MIGVGVGGKENEVLRNEGSHLYSGSSRVRKSANQQVVIDSSSVRIVSIFHLWMGLESWHIQSGGPKHD